MRHSHSQYNLGYRRAEKIEVDAEVPHELVKRLPGPQERDVNNQRNSPHNTRGKHGTPRAR